jgi:hypothetical protein
MPVGLLVQPSELPRFAGNVGLSASLATGSVDGF